MIAMAGISPDHQGCQSHGKILPNKFTIFNEEQIELEKVDREIIYKRNERSARHVWIFDTR